MGDDGKLEPTASRREWSPPISARNGIVPSRTTDYMVLLPLLDRHHEGKVGDADQRAAGFQGGLRSQRTARRGAAGPRRRRARALRAMGLQGSRRRDLGPHEEEPDGPLAGAGLRQLPMPKMTPRRAFQRLMAGDAEKVALGKLASRVVAVGVIPVSARHSHRDAGREHRPGRRPVDQLPAGLSRSGVTVSRGSPRRSRGPKRSTASFTSIARGNRALACDLGAVAMPRRDQRDHLTKCTGCRGSSPRMRLERRC